MPTTEDGGFVLARDFVKDQQLEKEFDPAAVQAQFEDVAEALSALQKQFRHAAATPYGQQTTVVGVSRADVGNIVAEMLKARPPVAAPPDLTALRSEIASIGDGLRALQAAQPAIGGPPDLSGFATAAALSAEAAKLRGEIAAIRPATAITVAAGATQSTIENITKRLTYLENELRVMLLAGMITSAAVSQSPADNARVEGAAAARGVTPQEFVSSVMADHAESVQRAAEGSV